MYVNECLYQGPKFCISVNYCIIVGIDMEQCCQGEAVTAASAVVPPTGAADHTHLPAGEGPVIYGR